MKFPIISDGDWIQLGFHTAQNREEALTNAAQAWIEAANENLDPEDQLRLDPKGPQGHNTPNLTLKVQRPTPKGWETESTWTSPDYNED